MSLPEEVSERVAGIIPAFNSGRLPNNSTASSKPQVELIILGVQHFLIKKPYAIKNITPPTAIGNRIYLAFEVNIVETGSAHGKWRMICSCDGRLQVIFGPSASGPTDVIRSCFIQYRETLENVVAVSIPCARPS